MTTTTLSQTAKTYLDAVRDGLAAVLPQEDAEEVLQDLEVHLVEIEPDSIEDTLGTPAEFIAEFRSSAGLDDVSDDSANIFAAIRSGLVSAGKGIKNAAAPLVRQFTKERTEIRTAWVWSRGVLAVIAYTWANRVDVFGNIDLLSPVGAGFIVQLAFVGVATYVSVKLGRAGSAWWKRLDFVASFVALGLMLIAATTTHWIPYAQEFDGSAAPVFEQDASPVLLLGPNGPIQNIFAYDTDGNPVQVLLYDEYGNPIRTLPAQAYSEAADISPQDEFIWEGFEIRFERDTTGYPVGNLFPLNRYEWTQTGARSGPQPPPVVGIPEFMVEEVATTTPQPPATTPTEQPTTTSTAPPTTTTIVTDDSAEDAETTSTTQGG